MVHTFANEKERETGRETEGESVCAEEGERGERESDQRCFFLARTKKSTEEVERETAKKGLAVAALSGSQARQPSKASKQASKQAERRGIADAEMDVAFRDNVMRWCTRHVVN